MPGDSGVVVAFARGGDSKQGVITAVKKPKELKWGESRDNEESPGPRRWLGLW